MRKGDSEKISKNLGKTGQKSGFQMYVQCKAERQTAKAKGANKNDETGKNRRGSGIPAR